MSSVLAFVDEPVARQLATGLVGSEVKLAERQGYRAGINFKVLLAAERAVEKSTSTKTTDLLPEVLADAIQAAITNRIDDLQEQKHLFVAGGSGTYRPGTPVILKNAKMDVTPGVPEVLSGEDCVVYRVWCRDANLKAYVPRSSALILDSLAEQPIEVAGLLRYTPSYATPGALSLNLGLRVCAIWLR